MQPMDNNEITAYCFKLLIKADVISREEMNEAIEDLENGVPNLLKRKLQEYEEADRKK